MEGWRPNKERSTPFPSRNNNGATACVIEKNATENIITIMIINTDQISGSNEEKYRYG